MATGKKLAKQVRLDERAAILRRKAEVETRNRNIVIAVFAVLILGGGGGLYLLTNPPSWFQGNQATVHTAALSIPDEGHNHITAGLPLGNKHEPPSSGNHYSTPLAPGVYPVAQPAGNWVHSLEHGYIAVVYRCNGAECADLNSQAKTIMDSLPKDAKYNEIKFVSTPYQNMTPKIAILAWDKEQDADTMDQSLIAAFYKQYVNHGREDLP